MFQCQQDDVEFSYQTLILRCCREYTIARGISRKMIENVNNYIVPTLVVGVLFVLVRVHDVCAAD